MRSRHAPSSCALRPSPAPRPIPHTEAAATKQHAGAIGDLVATDVFDSLCDALGSQNRNNVRAELAAKHLLCSLLAEISCSMHQVRDELDRAVKQIASSLLSYYIKRKHITIPAVVADAMADAAVLGIDRLIENMPAARSFTDLQRARRILGFTMCPAPEKQEAVMKCCLKPLGQPIVSELVQERLTAMPDWLQ